MTRRTAPTAAMAVGCLALALFLGGAAPPSGTLPQAPDFTLTLLDGKTLSLADLKGKPVLLNFWRSG